MEELVTPEADPELYQKGFVLICIAWFAPIPFLVLDLYFGSAVWFHRSGAITLFLVAFAQFKQLSLLQNKHFKNALRAKEQSQIFGLSKPYRKLEKNVFWAGLFGTLVLAYGDLVVNVVLAAT